MQKYLKQKIEQEAGALLAQGCPAFLRTADFPQFFNMSQLSARRLLCKHGVPRLNGGTYSLFDVLEMLHKREEAST